MEKDKTIRLINTLLKNIDHIYDEELIELREQIIKTLKSQVKVIEHDLDTIYKERDEFKEAYLILRREIDKIEQINKPINTYDNGGRIIVGGTGGGD